MNLKYPLLLGSASPRRKELLEKAGLTFTVKYLSTDESSDTNNDPREVALEIAKRKMSNYKLKYPYYTILTADTIVTIDSQVLGKPDSPEEAFYILNMLSGKNHEVITAVVIESPEHSVSFTQSTKVDFFNLNDKEKEKYVKSNSPFDKAGAYGIQDWIGVIGIKSIDGDYNNVMGLPVSLVYQTLKNKFC